MGWPYHKDSRCQMPAPSLPAASLSPQLRLPVRQALLRVSNDLICLGLWSIRGAILRAEANFLPALREGRRELALDAARGQALAGRGEAPGGADMVPLAVVHDRAQAAGRFGAVEQPDEREDRAGQLVEQPAVEELNAGEEIGCDL